MKILVTGANGYLGQGIVSALLNKNITVIASDLECNYVDTRAEIVQADLFQIEEPYTFFGEPDVVLHLAWRDGFKHDSINHINDLSNHFNFLKNLAEAGVKRICVMGSMHEIGFYEGCVDETTSTNPLSLYGIAKNALRQALEVEMKKRNVLFQWIRGFYIVGNINHGCSIFSKLAQAAKRGEKEFPFTSGQNMFDFIKYEEFCKQVSAVVAQEKILGIINCCSGQPIKLADCVETFIKENGFDIKLQYNVFPDRLYDSKAIWGDNSKIKSIMEKDE